MIFEVHDLDEYRVAGRTTPQRTKPKKSYSPRHAPRRALPGSLCNGIHRRHNKDIRV